MVRELSTDYVVWCNGMLLWGIIAHQGRSSGTDLSWITIIIFLTELEFETICIPQIKKLNHSEPPKFDTRRYLKLASHKCGAVKSSATLTGQNT